MGIRRKLFTIYVIDRDVYFEYRSDSKKEKGRGDEGALIFEFSIKYLLCESVCLSHMWT